MKKGNSSVGLVLLGFVALTAVIGLVVLFAPQGGSQGAVLTDVGVANVHANPNIRGSPGVGVSAEYIQTQPAQYADQAAYPRAVRRSTARVPAFVIPERRDAQERNTCAYDALGQGQPGKRATEAFTFVRVSNRELHFMNGQPHEVEGGLIENTDYSSHGAEVDYVGGVWLAFPNIPGLDHKVVDETLKARTTPTYNDWGYTTINGESVRGCLRQREATNFRQ